MLFDRSRYVSDVRAPIAVGIVLRKAFAFRFKYAKEDKEAMASGMRSPIKLLPKFKLTRDNSEPISVGRVP